MANEFPDYFRHIDARCAFCEYVLVDIHPTNNAPGRGHFRGYCTICRKSTWYDCAEGTAEIFDVNVFRKVYPTPKVRYLWNDAFGCPILNFQIGDSYAGDHCSLTGEPIPFKSDEGIFLTMIGTLGTPDQRRVLNPEI